MIITGKLRQSVPIRGKSIFRRYQSMTAKEYLSQARYLDNRIKSKLLQIDSLNELATRCTPSYSDMPKSPNREGSRMESAILDIIELEDEISKDVVELVALKKEIVEVIKQVGNTEYQTLLEERYLCFITWEQIAVDMGYELRYIHKLHGKALDEVKVLAFYEGGHEMT